MKCKGKYCIIISIIQLQNIIHHYMYTRFYKNPVFNKSSNTIQVANFLIILELQNDAIYS